MLIANSPNRSVICCWSEAGWYSVRSWIDGRTRSGVTGRTAIGGRRGASESGGRAAARGRRDGDWGSTRADEGRRGESIVSVAKKKKKSSASFALFHFPSVGSSRLPWRQSRIPSVLGRGPRLQLPMRSTLLMRRVSRHGARCCRARGRSLLLSAPTQSSRSSRGKALLLAFSLIICYRYDDSPLAGPVNTALEWAGLRLRINLIFSSSSPYPHERLNRAGSCFPFDCECDLDID